MHLENTICAITISIDETFNMISRDQTSYDHVLNPDHRKQSDLNKIFRVMIQLPTHTYFIALIGSLCSNEQHCAILEDHRLTVLQDNRILQINVYDGTIICQYHLGTDGCTFAIYKVNNGYLIHGEIDITMLDTSLHEMWSFSGEDIFVSISGKQPFQIDERSIKLYDFKDTYYELDFNGKLLSQRKG